MGAGEEIYAIGRLVAFRRAKSCRRRDERNSEVKEALPKSRDPKEAVGDEEEGTSMEGEVMILVKEENPTPPSTPVKEEPLRIRHHSLRKWWFL